MNNVVKLIPRTVKDTVVDQRSVDGYVNATAMCAAFGKFVANYRQNSGTQAFLEELEGAIGIPIAQLIQSVGGGSLDSRGTWVHPRVAVHLAQWVSPEFAVLVTGWVLDWMQGKSPSPVVTEVTEDRLVLAVKTGVTECVQLVLPPILHAIGGVQEQVDEVKDEVRSLGERVDRIDERGNFGETVRKRIFAASREHNGGKCLICDIPILDAKGRPISEPYSERAEIHHIHSRNDRSFQNGMPMCHTCHEGAEKSRKLSGALFQQAATAGREFHRLVDLREKRRTQEKVARVNAPMSERARTIHEQNTDAWLQKRKVA